jgi:hypothetical protein
MNENFQKYIWIFLIIGTFMSASMVKTFSLPYIATKPSLKKGYDKIFLFTVTIGNIPFIIIGIGMLTGYTNDISDYIKLTLNPVVICFQISMLSMTVYLEYWIHFKGGAKFLEQHPGVLNGYRVRKSTEGFTEDDIKTISIFSGFFIIVVFILMYIISRYKP